MSTRRTIISLIALTGLATLAHAQTPIEPNASRIELQVFDTTANAWTSSTNVTPNARVEWRIRVSYTGTNTNVFALGSVLYQPTFSNIDNDNEVGRSMSRNFQICSYEKTVGGNIVPQRKRLSE